MSHVLAVQPEPHEKAIAETPLTRLFTALDRAGLEYCVLSGGENWPHPANADIDCVMSRAAIPSQLFQVLVDEGPSIGIEIVQWLRDNAHFIVLRCQQPWGRGEAGATSETASGTQSPPADKPLLLQLHVAADCVIRQRVLYTGEDLLRTRRHDGTTWVPAAATAFTFNLAKRIVKLRVDEVHQRRLTALYRQDPDGCGREVKRFWSETDATRVVKSAAAEQWDGVLSQLARLRAELLRTTRQQRPLAFLRHGLFALGRRIRRWFFRDRGLSVVFLGVDGSGKSSVVAALRNELAPAFSSTMRHSFPPAWRQRDSVPTNSSPHDAKSRSYAMSVVRAVAYWFVHYSAVYYFTARRALCRNAMILHDRHLYDAMVDPKRYRYGGPAWLLRWISRLIPAPDLTILLDVPVDVARSRKQEVPPDEVARQRSAYLSLVENWPHAHVVNATQPLPDVVAQVRNVLCQHMTRRVDLLLRGSDGGNSKFVPQNAGPGRRNEQ